MPHSWGWTASSPSARMLRSAATRCSARVAREVARVATVKVVPSGTLRNDRTGHTARTTPSNMTNFRWNPFTHVASRQRRPSYTSLGVSPNPAVNGQQVTFTATVTTRFPPNVTGAVAFSVDGQAIGTVTLPTTTIAGVFPAGSHVAEAAYAGDAYHMGSLSAIVTFMVTGGQQSQVAWFSADELTFYVVFQSVQYAIPRPGGTIPWSLATLASQHGINTWYFVDPNGDDSNSGLDRQHPFKTVQHFILTQFNPGNGLVFRPGTLVGSCITNTQNAGPPGNGGTLANGIVFTCDDISEGGGLGSVLFQLDENTAKNGWPLDSQSTSVINVFNTNYLTINGLILQGAIGQPWAPQPYVGTPCGIKWSNGVCQTNRAQNCIAILAGHAGYKDQSGNTDGLILAGDGMFINGYGALDHGCYIPDSTNPTLTQCVSAFNSGFGYHFNGANTNLILEYSLEFANHQNGSGDGGVYFAQTSTNATVNHCTIAGTVGRGLETNHSITVRNSIMWGVGANGGGGVDTDSVTTGIDVDYCNIDTIGTSGSWPPPWSYGSHNVNPPSGLTGGFAIGGTNPQFTNRATGDFRATVNFPGSDGKNMGCYT